MVKINEKAESDAEAKNPEAYTMPVPPPKPDNGAANEATDSSNPWAVTSIV